MCQSIVTNYHTKQKTIEFQVEQQMDDERNIRETCFQTHDDL